MSRVHCLECGTQVVLDPRGVCPEGHNVGAAGARIEQAMGHELAHPDEPEPWVYLIEPSELTVVGAGNVGMGTGGAGSNGTAPRQARPVRVQGFDQEGDGDGDEGAESLLRELHSLAAFDEQHTAGSPAPQRSNGATTPKDRRVAGEEERPSPPPPPVRATPNAPRAPRPDPDAIAEAFAELSALDAPAQAMTPRPSANGRGNRNSVAVNGSAPTASGRDDQMDHAELASLFSDPTPPETHASGAPAPTTDAPGASAPTTDAPGAPAPTTDAPAGDDHAHDAPAADDPANDAAADDASPLPPPPAESALGGPGQDQAGPPAAAEQPELHSEPATAGGTGVGDDLAVDAAELSFELNFGDEQRPREPQPDITELLSDLGSDLFGDASGGDTEPQPAPTAGTAAAGGTSPTQDGHTGVDGADVHGAEATVERAPAESSTPPAPDHAATPTDEPAPDHGPTPTEGPTRSPAPDLTSFTAKGGATGRSGKRRLFGR